MTYTAKIMAAFGGVNACARAIGKPKQTTQAWHARGSIPDKHKAEILEASDRLGLGLTKEDFFPNTLGGLDAQNSH